MRLFPKDGIFYDLFEKQVEKLNKAVQLLKELDKKNKSLDNVAKQMEKLESEADDIGHSVVEHLITSFITPIEGDDIDILRQELDNIMDDIEKAVNRIVIYKLSRPLPKEIKEYVEIIERAISEIDKGVREIRDVRKFQDNLHYRCQKLNKLENEGDEINRRALKDLMDIKKITPKKNLKIIKLKEIYETLERAIDCCENVGNIFESILIKNR